MSYTSSVGRIKMIKMTNILKDYKLQKMEQKISPRKKKIIKDAVKKAVDEYGEAYRILASK